MYVIEAIGVHEPRTLWRREWTRKIDSKEGNEKKNEEKENRSQRNQAISYISIEFDKSNIENEKGGRRSRHRECR